MRIFMIRNASFQAGEYCMLQLASFTASWHLNLKPFLKGMGDTFLKQSLLMSNDLIKQEYLRIYELRSVFYCKCIISLYNLLCLALCHM